MCLGARLLAICSMYTYFPPAVCLVRPCQQKLGFLGLSRVMLYVMEAFVTKRRRHNRLYSFDLIED